MARAFAAGAPWNVASAETPDPSSLAEYSHPPIEWHSLYVPPMVNVAVPGPVGGGCVEQPASRRAVARIAGSRAIEPSDERP